MRAMSDWLCKKYRLSVIENPEGKKKNHALYVAEKNGQPSFPKLIRADIDNAILATNTRAAFFDYLEGMGYQLKLYKKNGDWREQSSLRPPRERRSFSDSIRSVRITALTNWSFASGERSQRENRSRKLTGRSSVSIGRKRSLHIESTKPG